MKVLWIINVILPEIAINEDVRYLPIGGWMTGLAKELGQRTELKLIFPYTSKLKGSVNYYTYESFITHRHDENKKNFGITGKNIKNIIDDYKPDVIHIHGTEYAHSFITSQIYKDTDYKCRIVASIQGLMSIYYIHYYSYLNNNIIKRHTLKDYIRGNIARYRNNCKQKGRLEIKTLRSLNNVIGRTEFDYFCTRYINSDINYYHNDEILREPFYNNQWNIANIEHHSIFMSQASLPLKGLHQMLNALAIIKKYYNDVHLYIAGKDYVSIPTIKQTYYERYINKLIQQLSINDNITFTGMLDDNEMCECYLKANVFASPSSIENSSNSVCEAMLLGMPIVSSYVGGIPSLITNEVEGFLYPADEPYMLAYYIIKIFQDDQIAVELGNNARAKAQKRHDKKKIVSELISIYKGIEAMT